MLSGDEPKQVTITIPQPPKISNATTAAKPATPATPPATGAATSPAAMTPAPETSAPKPAANPTIGHARVTSVPRGATITVDGATDPAWVTDMTVKDLKPGSHEFIVAKDGYVTQKLIQNVRAGETTSFTAVLVISGATLKISSVPDGANIFLDGKKTDQTTPADVHVDAGSHKIVVRKPGFREENTMVDVKDGDTYPFAPTMESNKAGGNNNNNQNNSVQVPPRLEQMLQRATQAGKGVLALITNPPGATLASNGQDWGKTSPFFGPLAPGTYHVTISMAGYRSQQRDIIIEAGKYNQVTVKLNP
jgi:hypothetical protein